MIGGTETKREELSQWVLFHRKVTTVLTRAFATHTHATLTKTENGKLSMAYQSTASPKKE